MQHTMIATIKNIVHFEPITSSNRKLRASETASRSVAWRSSLRNPWSSGKVFSQIQSTELAVPLSHGYFGVDLSEPHGLRGHDLFEVMIIRRGSSGLSKPPRKRKCHSESRAMKMILMKNQHEYYRLQAHPLLGKDAWMFPCGLPFGSSEFVISSKVHGLRGGMLSRMRRKGPNF